MSYSDKHYGAGDPSCPTCKGVGYISYHVPEDHPLFGKIMDCTCRKSNVHDTRASYLRRLGGLEFLTDKTFSSFDTSGIGLPPRQRENLQRIFQIALSYAEKPEGWLVLMGTYGCGKTHLAAAIANSQIESGQPTFIVSTPDLLDYLRSTFNVTSTTDEDSYQNRFDELKSAPLLVLDDLGVESPTSWANEKLYQLLNYRYVARLPTVITTNRDLDDLEERLRSRISDSDLCQIAVITAQDYRGGGASPSRGGLKSIGMYSEMTFANFKLRDDIGSTEKKRLQDAINIARSYASNPEGWLLIIGPPGTGKTHLAAAIANEQINQQSGQDLIMVYLPDMMDHLRATFSPSSQTTYSKEFDQVKRVSLLILDNLELASATPWALEKLHQLLNFRTLAKLPTVITSSYRLEDIEVFDQHLASRLRHRSCRIIAIVAPPHNTRKRQSEHSQ